MKRMISKKKSTKQRTRSHDEVEDLSYEMEQLFGENRILQPGQRNLVSLFFNGNMKGPQKLRPVAKGGRWVLFMALDLSTLTVIEHAAVSASWKDERWRGFFQYMIVESFTHSINEVADAAFNDYKNGEKRMHVLAQRYDNLYPHLDKPGQKQTRLTLMKRLNRKLHGEANSKKKGLAVGSSRPRAMKRPLSQK